MSETKKGFLSGVVKFLRSMTFGMILLILILLLSLAGSLITQGKEAAFYTETYGAFGKWILTLGWDHIYSVWYFGVLFALLCVNLLFCSVLRSLRMRGGKASLVAAAGGMPVNVKVSDGALQHWLSARKLKAGSIVVKGKVGLYGSLITHLGMLLLILAAAATLSLHTDTEHTLKIGEEQKIGNLTVVANSFRTTNEEGKTDYVSNVSFTDAQGNTQSHDLSVNHPVTIGNRKFYQQGYEFAGIPAEVTSTENGKTESFLFDLDAIENSLTFLSLNGKTGIALMDVYPDVVENEDGSVSPVSTKDGSMPNPVYLVHTISDEGVIEGVAYPGTELSAAGIRVSYGMPQYNPILMVKESPVWVLPVLYASFGILLLGLFLCFCVDARVIIVKPEGITVYSRKSTEDAVEKLEEQIKEAHLS